MESRQCWFLEPSETVTLLHREVTVCRVIKGIAAFIADVLILQGQIPSGILLNKCFVSISSFPVLNIYFGLGLKISRLLSEHISSVYHHEALSD